MTAKKYDLIVIGSGPAGEKGAAQAAYFGKSVALIEKEPVLGGAAANTGTLPSKTLRESALYLSGFKQRGLYGMTFELKEKVTARDFLYRERLVVQGEQLRISNNIQAHDVDLYQGFAKFEDEHTLEVIKQSGTKERIEGEIILIAAGSNPFQPPKFPFSDPRVHDSDTILEITDIPESMVIAGGGVIGCEYACMFAALGVKVSLIEGRDKLLPFMDDEVVDTLTKCMLAMGVEIRLSDEIEEVTAGKYIGVTLRSGGGLNVGALLAATGRSGNTAEMGLEDIGLKPGKRGHLAVNEHYQTSLKHVYAAGDVIGFPALASTAMEQARIAMVHAFNLKYKTKLATILPYGIYTIPECSMAGKTEEELRQDDIEFVVGKARYNTNARGQIIGDDDGFLKLIFEKNEMRLLGVHVIGESASELIHVGLTALLTEADADLFIHTCYNYPTLTELYKYATYDALGKNN
ncbi:MAG: Si-specific NAD(P)(+) transhydrogenase [Pseudomonadota bacterium]|nr:Si-specific NAD(P)(+) transhydrogenase [Pseudomonadota bacterium]